MTRPKVFLIGDTSDRMNWGCRATSSALRTMISEHADIIASLDLRRLDEPILRQVPRTYMQGPPHMSGSRATPRTVMRRSRRWLARRIFGPSARDVTEHNLDVLAKRLRSREILPHVHDALGACDVVIANGEGGVMGRRETGRLKFLIGHASSRYFARPFLMVNHTADLRNPTLRKMAEITYPECADVAFREPLSYRDVAPLCTNVTLAADAAFMHRPSGRSMGEIADLLEGRAVGAKNIDAIEWDQPYVCVGGSSVYKGKNSKFHDVQHAYRTLICDLRVLAQIVITASSVPDDIILEPIAEEFGLPYLGLLTPTDLCVDVLGGADLYLGGRWHPSIMALAGGTPIIEWTANSRNKSAGIIEIAGLDQPEISAMDLAVSRRRILDLAQRYVAGGAELRNSLSSRIDGFADTARDNVRYLAARVS